MQLRPALGRDLGPLRQTVDVVPTRIVVEGCDSQRLSRRVVQAQAHLGPYPEGERAGDPPGDLGLVDPAAGPHVHPRDAEQREHRAGPQALKGGEDDREQSEPDDQTDEREQPGRRDHVRGASTSSSSASRTESLSRPSISSSGARIIR